MDLNDILQKTKNKSEQIKVVRKRPSIATEDRPYTIDASEKFNLKTNIGTKKTDNKLATNQQQNDNKPTTKWQQKGVLLKQEKQYQQQTGNKLATQPATEVATNRQQTDNKLTTKVHFTQLIGLQRAIVIFLYKICKSSRAKTTEPIALEHIASYVKTSIGTVKTTIQRLEAKACVIRIESKNGRGGWSRYELPEWIFQEMLHNETDNKLTTNWLQTDNKLAAEPVTEPATKFFSSGSNNYKTTTTETVPIFQKLSAEWENIDITPLAPFGFTQTHLAQIAGDNKLTSEIVQDSIFAFAFDLENNNKTNTLKSSPLNYLMGILRSGKPYAPPSNYESPQDKAMRLYLESKRQVEQKRADMEKELLDLAFFDWEKQLSDTAKQDLLPDDIRFSRIQAAKTAHLRTYFSKEVWPEKRKEILLLTENKEDATKTY
jgi:hypothetical protein